MRVSYSVPAMGDDHRHLSKDEMTSTITEYRYIYSLTHTLGHSLAHSSGIPSKNDKILATFFSLDTSTVTRLNGDSFNRSTSKLNSKIYITKNKYGHKVTTNKNKLNTLATMKGVYYEKWRIGSDIGKNSVEHNFAGNEVE